jgi:hypothetical protein
MPTKKKTSSKKLSPKINLVFPDPEDGLFTTYSNHVQIGFTQMDVRLVFGEVVDSTAGTITVEQRTNVTMSWLQAKILIANLTQVVSDYESRFGELKLPPGADELEPV